MCGTRRAKLFVLILSCCVGVRGLNVDVTSLCTSRQVTLDSTGIIRYSGESLPCNLHVINIHPGSVIEFTGSEKTCFDICPLSSKLEVGGDEYCPVCNISISKTADENGEFVIELDSGLHLPPFDLMYKIRRELICGKTVSLQNGVYGDMIGEYFLSSSINSTSSCYWTLANIPMKKYSGRAAHVQFEILDWNSTEANGVQVMVGSSGFNHTQTDPLVISPETNITELVVSISSVAATPAWSFVLKYKVLVCTDPPPVANGYASIDQLPAFNGTIARYHCNHLYKLFNQLKDGRTCRYDGLNIDMYWSETTDLLCVRDNSTVPNISCFMEPPTLLGARRQYNLSASQVEYDCRAGYKRAANTPPLVINCVSSNASDINAKYIWEKQTAALICVPDWCTQNSTNAICGNKTDSSCSTNRVTGLEMSSTASMPTSAPMPTTGGGLTAILGGISSDIIIYALAAFSGVLLVFVLGLGIALCCSSRKETASNSSTKSEKSQKIDDVDSGLTPLSKIEDDSDKLNPFPTKPDVHMLKELNERKSNPAFKNKGSSQIESSLTRKPAIPESEPIEGHSAPEPSVYENHFSIHQANQPVMESIAAAQTHHSPTDSAPVNARVPVASTTLCDNTSTYVNQLPDGSRESPVPEPVPRDYENSSPHQDSEAQYGNVEPTKARSAAPLYDDVAVPRRDDAVRAMKPSHLRTFT